jgi:hypothetical protein
VTELVGEGIASNKYCGDELLRKLLREHGDDIQITERVLEAAAGNANQGIKILAFLLQERTKRVMEAAAPSTESGVTILDFLLKEPPDEAEITERVLEAVAGNLKIGDQIMDYVLRDDAAISERVLEAASRNKDKR